MIYTIGELQNKSFDESEFNNLIDSNDLYNSIIFYMFRIIKPNISINNVNNIIKNKNWFNKYNWTWAQQDKFTKNLIKVFKNIYYDNDYSCLINAQNFVSKYGFRVIDTDKNFDKHIQHIFNY